MGALLYRAYKFYPLLHIGQTPSLKNPESETLSLFDQIYIAPIS